MKDQLLKEKFRAIASFVHSLDVTTQLSKSFEILSQITKQIPHSY